MMDDTDRSFLVAEENIAEYEGYLFEPEYSPDEIRQRREQQQAALASSAIVASERSRADSSWWCSCQHCPQQRTEVESLCCQEWNRGQFLLREAEEMEDGSELSCLNQHSSFQAHLDRGVLETFFHLERINWRKQRRSQGPGGQLSNRQLRLVGYRIILEWVLRGERLGRHNRAVLPACVVDAVRQRYPSPDGQYTGFLEVREAAEGIE
ncbi:uncharacterized protein [Misgurnus anguillicaudatus]|uniref:uncharacterized protein n=1 Tax=Misgurnus anguillicaudatus TaxID=75329 RepID=UPI0024349089|nr:uncharacterized protein LOC129447533 [Misgurnus anguillicaudatus]